MMGDGVEDLSLALMLSGQPVMSWSYLDVCGRHLKLGWPLPLPPGTVFTQNLSRLHLADVWVWGLREVCNPASCLKSPTIPQRLFVFN